MRTFGDFKKIIFFKHRTRQIKYLHIAFLLFLCKAVSNQLRFSCQILHDLARLLFVPSTVEVLESNLQCILLCTL